MTQTPEPQDAAPARHEALRAAGMLDEVVLEDCMSFLPRVPAGSVDLVLCDLPYGTTRNKWDSTLDLEVLWKEYWRILKPGGAVVLTAAQPFTSVLVCSNLKDFKCEWIWSKTVGSGQLNIKHQPLRTHESVLVFYRKLPSYNPQMTAGTPYSMHRKATYEGPGYNQQRDVEVVNEGFRHPKSVLLVPNPRIKGGHPTQKPVPLFEYFIKTYSNPGDVVLDHCIGAGTTAVAALRTGRHWVGVELEEKYHTMSLANLEAARAALAAEAASAEAAGEQQVLPTAGVAQDPAPGTEMLEIEFPGGGETDE